MILTDISALAQKLKNCSSAAILTHAHPDGDTLGAGFGLCYYLRSVGIKANVLNSEPFPEKFAFLYKDYEPQDFEPESVISVDVAAQELLGEGLFGYADKIDLCIDHHFSNRMPARDSYVDGGSCAVCLIIFELLKELGAEITPRIACCLYTGIATDTGCFMFENTSPEAHRAAAALVEAGAKASEINREMFQVKSRGRLFAEQKAIGEMKFAGGGKIALITVTNELIDGCGVDRADLDGFAGIPLSVEGVEIGITLKQQPEGVYKASVRTVSADASAIAKRFGGGGHIRAAGCTLTDDREESEKMITEAAAEFL